MKRILARYSRTVAAIVGLFALGIFSAVYVVTHERLRLPFVSPAPFELQAELAEAKAITPGQGQTVTVAGVKVGDIVGVHLGRDGYPVATLNIDPQFRNLIHTDATALVRPRTGLDDMFIDVDPGSNSAPLVRPGDTIPLTNTLPFVDTDEILASLDTDTREYLDLLLSGAAQGLQDNGLNLRDLLRRYGPTHQDLARFAQAVATRRANLRRLIHSLNLLNTALEQRAPQIVQLVQSSAVTLHALAVQQHNLSATVTDLPAALAQTTDTLNKVKAYANLLGPTATRLQPVFRQLNLTNYAVRPFARIGTPIIANQIRPFVIAARPLVRDLRPASQSLAAATPSLTRVFMVLNHLFNMVAFNQSGAQPPTDPARHEGYLFWIAWLDHQTLNLFSSEDANGNFRPLTLGGTCQTFESLVSQQPALEFMMNLTPLLTSQQGCDIPPSQLPPLTSAAAGLAPTTPTTTVTLAADRPNGRKRQTTPPGSRAAARSRTRVGRP